NRHDGFAIAVSRIGADDGGIDALGIEDIFVWRIRNRFTGVFVQLRLGIERFQVRDAAAEEDPDGRFGARTKMGPAVGWTIARQRVALGDAVFEEHGREGQAGEAHASVEQERAAGDAGAAVRFWFSLKRHALPCLAYRDTI